MSQKHTLNSVALVAVFAMAIFVVALGLFLFVGKFAILGSIFMAFVIALLAAIVLFIGAARKAAEAAAATAATASGPMPEAASEDETAEETAGEASRPAGLDAPRDGKADDLKQIKGIGPKMEQVCNRLGYWHFDQIAAWTPDEVAWVDANLEGFPGRVTRDHWVEQAKPNFPSVLRTATSTDASDALENLAFPMACTTGELQDRVALCDLCGPDEWGGDGRATGT